VRLEGSLVCVEPGAADVADTVVTGTARGFYALFVDRDFDAVEVEGDGDALERLVRAVPQVETVVA
jgi:hypothetical protein